jgi:hypothetical protein
VTTERLGELREVLESLQEPASPFQATLALEFVRQRGLDLSGFRELLEAPVRTMEQADPERPSPDLRAALFALEMRRVTWSDRAARALERAAVAFRGRSDGPVSSEELDRVAREIRAHLDARWK